MLVFGENGASLVQLEESALERELSDKTAQYGILSCVTTLMVAALVSYVIAFHPDWFRSPFVMGLLFLTIALALLPCALAFAAKAVIQGYLPKRLGGEPVHRHVGPGMSVLVIAALFAIVFIARVFEANIGRLAITDRIGLLVVSIIGIAFLSLIFVPHVLKWSNIQSAFRTASINGFFQDVHLESLDVHSKIDRSRRERFRQLDGSCDCADGGRNTIDDPKTLRRAGAANRGDDASGLEPPITRRVVRHRMGRTYLDISGTKVVLDRDRP